MKKFTICMVSILMAIPLFAKTYSLQEAISNGSAEICKKIDGNINTVVIVDVQSDSESLSDYIYSELNYNFVNNLKKTFVAERNEFTLSLIKKEFEYQNSGEVSDVTIQSVGNSLGAECVVLGKIEDSSSGWKFSLKAVQVETKKILSVWSGMISKNDKDVKFIVSKDNEAHSLNNGVSYVDLANKAYEEGDYKLAFEYFLKADEITDSYSQGNLGWLYQTGEGGFQNYAKAFDWYLKSAKQGDAFSQNKIGIFYFNGYGVNKSYKDAKIWYEKAAEQGNIYAQTSLGYLYQYGYGVTKDLKKAKDLYNQSAVQGDPVAQYNLGVLYQNGFGVPVDYVEAIEWYEKAAGQGYELAITALDGLKTSSSKTKNASNSSKVENYGEKRITRTEVFFPYTSNPWSEEWEYIYYEKDKGKVYDSNSYPEYWLEKLAKPKLRDTYFTEINDLTELQYATKILKDYGTVFVICRAEKETRYFQAVKLEDSTIFVLYFSADELKN